MAVGESGDRQTEWEGLTQRERAEHSQGTNNVTDSKSLNQQWKPEYSGKLPSKNGERTTVTSKLCPWENFQERGQNKVYLHIKNP